MLPAVKGDRNGEARGSEDEKWEYTVVNRMRLENIGGVQRKVGVLFLRLGRGWSPLASDVGSWGFVSMLILRSSKVSRNQFLGNVIARFPCLMVVSRPL